MFKFANFMEFCELEVCRKISFHGVPDLILRLYKVAFKMSGVFFKPEWPKAKMHQSVLFYYSLTSDYSFLAPGFNGCIG